MDQKSGEPHSPFSAIYSAGGLLKVVINLHIMIKNKQSRLFYRCPAPKLCFSTLQPSIFAIFRGMQKQLKLKR
jgi:hypothetical protein